MHDPGPLREERPQWRGKCLNEQARTTDNMA